LFIMPRNKDLKRLVRARMAETGERYIQALTYVLSQPVLEPLSTAWFMTGSHAPDYEAGLLPESITYDGGRVVRLRLRVADSEPLGFGALMQCIVATRYLGRRVRFSAMARAQEVTGWAGLWLRIDGPGGQLVLDNMQDRPLRQVTGWTKADIVLDVPEQAAVLNFGALLSGAGALDLTGLRFEEVAADVAVTAAPHMAGPLPDEPQALDFVRHQ
jgi:hypothetical protein